MSSRTLLVSFSIASGLLLLGACGSSAEPAGSSSGEPAIDGGASSGASGSSGAGASSGGGGSSGIGSSSGEGGAVRQLGAVPAAVVAAAVAAPLGRFGVNGGGERYCTDCDGASIVLAIAALAGDTSADARLLEQMRWVLGGGRDPFGNGGYMAQHERMMTGMFAIAKRVPRIWSALGADEIARVDLVMKATLVGSAHTTSDANNEGATPTGIDGDTNLNRGWNPNYREGMVGAMIVSTLYFGGRAATDAILDGYDHAAFVGELDAAGLTHLHDVFADGGGPSAAELEAGIASYRYLGHHLGELPAIFTAVTENTYGGIVACGLEGGAGIDIGGGQTSGRIEAGCAALPSLGSPGQLLELDSVDANGKRSSLTYAYDGFAPNLINHLVLLVYGEPGADAVMARVRVGADDLFYKATQGYRNYAKGQDRGVFKLDVDGEGGYAFMRPLHQSVLLPAYE